MRAAYRIFNEEALVAHIVFDLSSSESRSRFRELAADMLDLLDGPMSERFFARLKAKAQALELAAPDFHAIMLDLLRASGGRGFTFADNSIRCPACNAVQQQVAWLCTDCGVQVVEDLGMRLERVRASGAAARFVQEQHGRWNHEQWLSFRRSIERRFGFVPETMLGALLEDTRRQYTQQLEADRLERGRQELEAESRRIADEQTRLQQERKAFADKMRKETDGRRRETERSRNEELARLERERQEIAAESRRIADERTRLQQERRSFEKQSLGREEELRERDHTARRSADDELAKRLTLMFDMVTVPSGSYKKEGASYHIDIFDDFKICLYPVTQFQWITVMGSNPSTFRQSVLHPVESVSYVEVEAFISRLNQLTGESYRLPIEAEWEYAARSGGRNEKWSGTSNEQKLEEYCWNVNNSVGSTKPVGLKKPNCLGIYDMSGNVWEWCHDLVLRGGSWSNGTEFVTVASRRKGKRTEKGSFIGFRLVLSV
jgi:formylglycine-generating enzyme required for sulfatase activity